jgi:hypothetical protein
LSGSVARLRWKRTCSRPIGRGSKLTRNPRRFLAVVAARRLWFRAAWRRVWLGFRVARVRTRRGLSRRLGVAEELGLNPNRRGVRGDHARVPSVFIPISLGGMTGGVQVSRTERETGVTVRGGREVGCGLDPDSGRSAAPRPLNIFPIFLLLLFCFLFNFV